MGFLEFIRGEIAESAANTYTEQELRTPVSRSESLAMLIHQIQFAPDFPDIEDGQANSISTVLAGRTSTSILAITDPDRLDGFAISNSYGAVEGTLSEFGQLAPLSAPAVWRHFNPPILFPRDALFLEIQGTGNATVKTGRVQVGYELAKVDPGDFIAALVD